MEEITNLSLSEIKKLLIDELSGFMEENNLYATSNKYTPIRFKEKSNKDYRFVDIHFNNYLPISAEVTYFYGRRISIVEDILKNLAKSGVELPTDYFPESGTVLRNFEENKPIMPQIKSKNDIQVTAGEIIKHMKATGIKLLVDWGDIRYIDGLINKLPIKETVDDQIVSLGGNFVPKRMIIAHLCGNTHFEEINKVAIGEEDRLIEMGYGSHVNRKMRPARLKLLEILKDIQPIY